MRDFRANVDKKLAGEQAVGEQGMGSRTSRHKVADIRRYYIERELNML